MSTFREIAAKAIEEGIADLQSRGEVLDEHGVLAGAMVDAATIAVQDWLTVQRKDGGGTGGRQAHTVNQLIREAGRVEAVPPETVDDLLFGCPIIVWDGPYKMRCAMGVDVCSRHGKFERARRCGLTSACRWPQGHGGTCDGGS